MRRFTHNQFLLAAVISVFFLVQACEQKGWKTTESGLKYEYIVKGNGTEIDSGYVYMLNLSYSNEEDSLMFNSTDQGYPLRYPYPAEPKGMLEEGIQMLKAGDSLHLQVPALNFFVSTVQRPVPPGIRDEELITFRMGVDTVLTLEQFPEYARYMNEKIQREMEIRRAAQLNKDIVIIDDFLSENGIEAQTTESGLRYVIHEQGTGENAMAGQMVEVHYDGRLLDGTPFDTSIEEVAQETGTFNAQRTYEPLKFPLGMGRVIPGWDEGISLLNPGSKATIYIPSSLAYGESARGDVIKENSILVFNVELISATNNEQ